jgi:hypothetical protein
MVGLRYVRVKWGRLRCDGLDTVEGLVKTVYVFDKSISGDKADLSFQNARCKERMRKLCVFRDRIYLSRLVDLGYSGYYGNLSVGIPHTEFPSQSLPRAGKHVKRLLLCVLCTMCMNGTHYGLAVSVCPHESTREPLDGLEWSLVWRLCHWGIRRNRIFKFPTIDNNKMADEETGETGNESSGSLNLFVYYG